MRQEKLLHTMSTELPIIIRQLDSADPTLQAAAKQRLRDLAHLLQPWLLLARARRQPTTFAAMSLKWDD
jgi:hypothetical protein